MEEKATLPVYECHVIDDMADASGVFRVSFVQFPAIEKGWVALSAERRALHLSDKQIVTGPALIPDKLIFRMGEEGGYFIKFRAVDIEAIALKFARLGAHKETNLEHSIPLVGNTVMQSWIVSEELQAGATKLMGYEVPVGTWMLSIHVADKAVWDNEIKTGKRTGFSIEGLFDLEEAAQLSKVKPLKAVSKMNFFERIKAGLAKRQAAKLGEAKLADGRAIVWDDATMAVTFQNEDGTPGDPLPDGSYTLETGETIDVAAGIITKTTAATAAAEVAMHTVTLRNGFIIDIDPATLEAFRLEADGTGAMARKPLQDGSYETLDWYSLIVAGGKFSRQHSSYPFIAEQATATATAPDVQMSDLVLSLADRGDEFKARAEAAEAQLAAITTERDAYKAKLSTTPGGTKIVTTPAEEVKKTGEDAKAAAKSGFELMAERIAKKEQAAKDKAAKK